MESPCCVPFSSDSSRNKVIETQKLEKGEFSQKKMDFIAKTENYLMV